MLNSISLYLLRLKAIFLKRIFILQAFSSPKTPYQVLKLKRLNPPKLHIQTIKTNPHKNCPLSLSCSMDDSVLPAIILRNPPSLVKTPSKNQLQLLETFSKSSSERVSCECRRLIGSALPINLRYIYKRVFTSRQPRNTD